MIGSNSETRAKLALNCPVKLKAEFFGWFMEGEVGTLVRQCLSHAQMMDVRWFQEDIYVKNVLSPLSAMFFTDMELFYVNGTPETCFNRRTKEIVIVSSMVPII